MFGWGKLYMEEGREDRLFTLNIIQVCCLLGFPKFLEGFVGLLENDKISAYGANNRMP